MKGQVLDDGALVMSDIDTVATAIDDLEAGRTFDLTELALDPGNGAAVPETVELVEDVPFGHKVALVAHEDGDDVYKYGEVIGAAAGAVAVGEWVHTHNCESKRGRGDLAATEGSA
ncbi:MAG: SAF domain-containing protein [Halobacteriaceae archaeon]